MASCDGIVYTDGFRAGDVLDVPDFHHIRINHSNLFAEDRNHINEIENFWQVAFFPSSTNNDPATYLSGTALDETHWR